MKVKVRVNIHGIFIVSSASLVEVIKSDETEEPMETEQVNDKDGEVINDTIICATRFALWGCEVKKNTVYFPVCRTRCKPTRRSRMREMVKKNKKRRRPERMRRWR